MIKNISIEEHGRQSWLKLAVWLLRCMVIMDPNTRNQNQVKMPGLMFTIPGIFFHISLIWLQKKDLTPEQIAKFLLEMLVQLRN